MVRGGVGPITFPTGDVAVLSSVAGGAGDHPLPEHSGLEGLAVAEELDVGITWKGAVGRPQFLPHSTFLLCCLQSIDPGQQFTWENSNLEVNKPKNRYANVIAYDHSRVILTSIDGKPKTEPPPIPCSPPSCWLW